MKISKILLITLTVVILVSAASCGTKEEAVPEPTEAVTEVPEKTDAPVPEESAAATEEAVPLKTDMPEEVVSETTAPEETKEPEEVTETEAENEEDIIVEYPPLDVLDYLSGPGEDLVSELEETAGYMQGVTKYDDPEYPLAAYKGKGLFMGYDSEKGMKIIISKNAPVKVYPVELGMGMDEIEEQFRNNFDGGYEITSEDDGKKVTVTMGKGISYVFISDDAGKIASIEYTDK
jgi:hypothetical protein